MTPPEPNLDLDWMTALLAALGGAFAVIGSARSILWPDDPLVGRALAASLACALIVFARVLWFRWSKP